MHLLSLMFGESLSEMFVISGADMPQLFRPHNNLIVSL